MCVAAALTEEEYLNTVNFKNPQNAVFRHNVRRN